MLERIKIVVYIVIGFIMASIGFYYNYDEWSFFLLTIGGYMFFNNIRKFNE